MLCLSLAHSPTMNIGPMLEALPELLPLPWKHDTAELSRQRAAALIRRFCPGARIPLPGWELLLVEDGSAGRHAGWRLQLWLVNQAVPNNLEFVMGLGIAKTPLYLELRWRYNVRMI